MSTTTLPNIPTEVRDALDSYGNLCGDAALVAADKDATGAELADAIAARNRVKDELIISIERWAKRQIRVTAGTTIHDCEEALAHTEGRNGPPNIQQARYYLRAILGRCRAVMEGGAL